MSEWPQPAHGLRASLPPLEVTVSSRQARPKPSTRPPPTVFQVVQHIICPPCCARSLSPPPLAGPPLSPPLCVPSHLLTTEPMPLSLAHSITAGLGAPLPSTYSVSPPLPRSRVCVCVSQRKRMRRPPAPVLLVPKPKAATTPKPHHHHHHHLPSPFSETTPSRFHLCETLRCPRFPAAAKRQLHRLSTPFIVRSFRLSRRIPLALTHSHSRKTPLAS